jgi:chromate transporter
VVGLIAGTSITLLIVSVVNAATAVIFVVALAALFKWSARWIVPVVIASAAAAGLILNLAAAI